MLILKSALADIVLTWQSRKMASIFLELSATANCITAPSLRENEIITGKNILNPVDGESTEFGAQTGGKTRKEKLRRLLLWLIRWRDNWGLAGGFYPLLPRIQSANPVMQSSEVK